MDVTLTLLPPEIVERAQVLAHERNTTLDALLSEAITEYIQQQEYIAYAREMVAKIQSGEFQLPTQAETKAWLRRKGRIGSIVQDDVAEA